MLNKIGGVTIAFFAGLAFSQKDYFLAVFIIMFALLFTFGFFDIEEEWFKWMMNTETFSHYLL